MKRFIMLVSIWWTISLVGCTTWTQQGAPEMARYIDTYCASMDKVARDVLRDSVNNLTKLGDIQITCEGDIPNGDN